MKKIRSKFLTFLLCAGLVLAPSIKSEAKLNIIDEHNAVDLETGIEHIDYPSMTTYLTERNKILSGIDAAWSTERKLLYIHDYIVLNTEYDSELAKSSSDTIRKPQASNQAYGPIVTHKAICQGYADAFLDLATHIGVPTIRVRNAGHTWNAVKLNGQWYYVDCTHDDSNASSSYCSHANFLKSEMAMRENGHNGTFYHNRLVFNDIGWYVQDVPINGKYTSTTYDDLNLHNTKCPVVSLKDGSVIYYNDTDEYGADDHSLYLYKFDGKAPEKLLDMDTIANQYTGCTFKISDYITGNDSKIVIHTTGNEWEYSVSKKTVKLISGKAKKIGKGLKFTSKNITYKITGDSTVSVYSIKKTVKTVEIPDQVEFYGKKYKVTAIAKNAGKNGKVKTLDIGRNVKTIGASAFYGCPLKTITLGSTRKSVLTQIGKNAFKVSGKPKAAINYKLKKKQKKVYQDMLLKAGYPKKGTFTDLWN